MDENLSFLLYLAGKAGLFDSLKTSTIKISKDAGVSQQTVSRKLRELESLELIKRQASPEGIVIALDEKGIKLLEKNYGALKNIFEQKIQKLTGTVEKGLGEGSYYVSIYKKHIQEKLGFAPFIGTLNLSVNKAQAKNFLMQLKKIKIHGFQTKSRTFGAIDCYKVKISDKLDGAVIIPERTNHDESILEVIAPVSLRKKFNLIEGNKITLTK